MVVVTATLSIAPGHSSTVTTAAREQLQAGAAAGHCLGLLAAEICEVNTLLGLFTGPAIETLLADVRAWLTGMQAAPAGQLLRHVQCDVHETQAGADQVRQLAAVPTPAVLLQVLRAPATAAAPSVVLNALTGLQQRATVLTPVRSQDEAVALALASLQAGIEIADSGLWLPIPFANSESNA